MKVVHCHLILLSFSETEKLFGESNEEEAIFSKKALDFQVDEPKKPPIVGHDFILFIGSFHSIIFKYTFLL